MNVPMFETEHLVLRRFTERDLHALYLIYSDKEANRFLPWFPAANIDDARSIFDSRYADPAAFAYAVCLKADDYPIGYVNIGNEEPYDLGYGLRKEFWHRGIMTEAVSAVVECARKCGIPYLTATHDRNNPRSGGVMRNIGMWYEYSYEEQWQPKDFSVVFRMYQLNFSVPEDYVYKGYWDNSSVHFIESVR